MLHGVPHTAQRQKWMRQTTTLWSAYRGQAEELEDSFVLCIARCIGLIHVEALHKDTCCSERLLEHIEMTASVDMDELIFFR